jgi:hypothetical protein
MSGCAGSVVRRRGCVECVVVFVIAISNESDEDMIPLEHSGLMDRLAAGDSPGMWLTRQRARMDFCWRVIFPCVRGRMVSPKPTPTDVPTSSLRPRRWHHRLGCASIPIIEATQRAVSGMTIQKDSLSKLAAMLPCEGCAAGKFIKAENPKHHNFTPLSNNPSTTNKFPGPAPQNMHVALDFGICVNQPCRSGNTCFAIFMDLGVKIVYTKSLPSRGVIVIALRSYCQRLC